MQICKSNMMIQRCEMKAIILKRFTIQTENKIKQ